MSICPSRLKESSAVKAASRQQAAEKVLGKAVVSRIIGFALFLLGYARSDIADITGTDLNTFLSFLTRMSKFGLDGFRDRRRQSAAAVSQPVEIAIGLTRRNDGALVIETDYKKELIMIPAENFIQQKVFLLTLGINGLVNSADIAEQLDCTAAYVCELQKKLKAGDVAAVLDKRRGQTTDYRVTEEIKGELILQWAVNSVTGRPSSSPAISNDLNERCAISLPERTIRDHLKKLGLNKLAEPLFHLVKDTKKGSMN